MKKLFLVANWKSNKTVSEAHSFMISFLNREFIDWLHKNSQSTDVTKKIVLCPPSILLPTLSKYLEDKGGSLPLFLGAQDVSPFEEGPHTGEEAAKQLSEYARYVIIGHSERRSEFGETDEMVVEKVRLARMYNLEPIVCVQTKNTPVPENVHIVAYEPIDAIGTGNPAIPESAEEVALHFKKTHHIPYVLYGGSVTPENVQSFTSQPAIDGVLVGGASLDPVIFSDIIRLA